LTKIKGPPERRPLFASVSDPAVGLVALGADAQSSFARCNRIPSGDFVIDVEIIDPDGTGTPREGPLDLRQGREASAA
jgi:hypothetical protein